jgi:hypothetical protein
VCVDVVLLVGKGIGWLGWTRYFGTERGFGFTLDIFNFGTWNGRSGEGSSVHMGLLIMMYADAGQDMQHFMMGSRDVHSFIWR